MRNLLIEISKKYFKTFSHKDLSGMENMFSKDIRLKDWDTEARGLEDVLKINKNIFEKLESIQVNPLKIYNDGNTVVAELDININNGQESLLVVDVIVFDSENKILYIRAYKG
jgi:hypothetical protein